MKERLYIDASYALYIERNPERRMRILWQLANNYPKEKRVYMMLGRYYESKELFHKAIGELHKALELDPNYGEALNYIAYRYMDIGEYAKAIDYFKRYANASPGDANPFDSMGDLYFRMGDLDAALFKYKEAIFVKPDFYASSGKIAFIYALREDYAKTMQWVDHLITAAPSAGVQAPGYSQKSFYNRLLGDLDQALIDLDTAEELLASIEHELGMATIDFTRMLIFCDQRNFQMGRNYLKNSYTNMPDMPANAVLYNFYLALIELKQGAIDAAKVRFTTIESLLPEVSIWYKEISLFSRDLLYAELLLVQDSLEKSVTVFEKTSPFEIEWAPGEYLIGIYQPFNRDVGARVFYRMGNFDRAILEYKKLLDPDPNKRGRCLILPTWHYELAKLYEQKGLYEQATQQYEKFLGIWKNADVDRPELIDAKKRLEKLNKNI
jgi:tetratricopeptide (TPR) repeat protein